MAIVTLEQKCVCVVNKCLTEIFSQLDSTTSYELGLLLHVFPKIIQHLFHIFLQPAN